MFLARRASAPARSLLRRQPRRFASTAGHEEHHAASANEHFHPSFYITLASIPVGLAVYKYSTSDPNKKPWVTQMIEKYSYSESTWERTNALHTQAIEKAAADRNLFYSQNEPVTIDLTFPEMFNVGSPMNVPAGHYPNMNHVVAHYENKNRQVEEKRLARTKNGKAESIYDEGF